MKFEYNLSGVGWADGIIEVNNQEHNFSISYLTDGLGDFLNALVNLNKFCNPVDECSNFEKIEWEAEPSGTELILKLINEDELHIKVVSYEELYEKLNPEIMIDTLCSYNEFLLSVIREIDKLIKLYGIVGYGKTWYDHEFPISTFLELKHYVINSKGYSTWLEEVHGMELEKTELKTDIELLLLDI